MTFKENLTQNNYDNNILNGLNSKFPGYRIPFKGQIQIIIKNPSKTAVKVFLIPYDFRDMPPNTKTFIRQKSYLKNIKNGNSHDQKYSLRYAIHLQFISPSKKRLYLYKTLRVVFAHKAPEKDEKLCTISDGPVDPKYIPIVDNNINNYSQNTNMSSVQQPNRKSNKGLFFLLIIIIVVICVFVFKPKGGNNSNSNSNSNSTSNSNVESNSNSNTTPTNTNYDKDGAFLMPIDDVFTITGKGTVVTGKISRGTIKINDEIEIIGLNHEVKTTVVTGIEMFRKQMDSAQIGDNVGLLLKDVSREDVERGQVVAKPNSIKETKNFEANVYF